MGNTIVEIYNKAQKLDPYHETVHVLMRSFGSPPALFNEGFAVYMVQGKHIRGCILPLKTWSLEIKAHPELEDELVIEFPKDMMKKLEWKVEDELTWNIDMGEIHIRKKDAKLSDHYET